MKIGIVGTGFVGSTIAYALLFRNAASEIVLIDINRERALAEAEDLSHAIPFSYPIVVRQGDYADLSDAVVVVIAAGVNQKPGETRIELLGKNSRIFSQIIPLILQHAPEAILLIATNPVDIMTYIAARYATRAGVSQSQVIGTGTTLDTARFRLLLGQYLEVDSQHVHGYVIGEHGDSEVLTWSIVDIGGLPLAEFFDLRSVTFDKATKNKIDEQVRNAAYKIIRGKGATYYGIGASAAHIINAITHNQKAILTISTPLKEICGVQNVCLSMPHLIKGTKLVDTLPLHLNEEETNALRVSAQKIKSLQEKYEQAIKDA